MTGYNLLLPHACMRATMHTAHMYISVYIDDSIMSEPLHDALNLQGATHKGNI